MTARTHYRTTEAPTRGYKIGKGRVVCVEGEFMEFEVHPGYGVAYLLRRVSEERAEIVPVEVPRMHMNLYLMIQRLRPGLDIRIEDDGTGPTLAVRC